MGLAGVRTNDNKEFFDTKSPLVVVYFDVDYEHNAKGSNYWRNRWVQSPRLVVLAGGPTHRVIKVAKDLVGEVYFAVSGKREMGAELQQFGVGPDQEVGVGLFDEKGRKYAMIEKFR